MAFLGQEEQIREFQDRFRYIYAVVFLALGLLLSRMVFLQVLKGDQMRRYSEENRIKRVKVVAPRGNDLRSQSQDADRQPSRLRLRDHPAVSSRNPSAPQKSSHFFLSSFTCPEAESKTNWIKDNISPPFCR